VSISSPVLQSVQPKPGKDYVMKTYTIRLIDDRGLVYDRFTYPAGETQVRVRPEHVDGIKDSETINIIARIRSAEDLIELVMLQDAVFPIFDGVLNLVLPYMPYSRADRRFTVGDCFGLTVFASFIDAMGFDKVVTLDAHSEATKLNLAPLVDVSPEPFIERAIGEFAAYCRTDRIVVLFPDKGAHDRYQVAEMVGCNTKVTRVKTLYATKKRNSTTGVFEGFEVPPVEDFEGLPTLVVDDICDGGGTFLGIAALMSNEVELGLYVTHGIFSKGVFRLLCEFPRIYTTNSFQLTEESEKYHEQGFVTVFDAMPVLMRECKA
jgi:ribose-phosphate pyrophosphokinase